MPLSSSPPLLASLHTLLKRVVAGRSGDSSTAVPFADSPPPARSSCFFAHVSPPPTAQGCHEALEMPEVLLQVFRHCAARELCTTIPLVCAAWRAVAESQQLWLPRCDAQLLEAVVQQHRQQPQPPPRPAPTADHAGAPSAAACSQPSLQWPVRLPLLHYAVFGALNLLRNPAFLEAANAQGSSHGTRSTRFSAALLTTAQRRFAWVPTVGSPVWGLVRSTGAPPAPLRYPAAAGATSSSAGACRRSCSTGCLGGLWRQRLSHSRAHPQAPAPAVAATAAVPPHAALVAVGMLWSAGTSSSSWTEVVQVVDLLAELTARGLDPDTAAAVLDSGAVALAFSVWVAAAAEAADEAAGPAAPARHPAPSSSPPQFAAALMLDDGQLHLRSFQTYVRRESSHHFFTGRLALGPRDGWRRYAYVLQRCLKGARRAVVLLRGRGVTLASAQLSFVTQGDADAFGASECLAAWAGRSVQGR